MMQRGLFFRLALVAVVLYATAYRWTIPPAGEPPSAFVSGATQGAIVSGMPVPEAGPEQPAATPNAEVRGAADPVHKVLIRLMGDLDDILDQIRDPASFAAAKPKLEARVREHADWVARQPNKGMSQLSQAAAGELQVAANRHARSILRAESVAPGVRAFF